MFGWLRWCFGLVASGAARPVVTAKHTSVAAGRDIRDTTVHFHGLNEEGVRKLIQEELARIAEQKGSADRTASRRVWRALKDRFMPESRHSCRGEGNQTRYRLVKFAAEPEAKVTLRRQVAGAFSQLKKATN